jgi:TIR domain-containing protein
VAEREFAFKAFLSHRYKSPEVNLSFFRLFSEQSEVQFEVDQPRGPNEEALALNVTRLERMIRSADAFIGIYPFPDATAAPAPGTATESSKYFRLEVEMALRAAKPMLLLYDQRYGSLFNYAHGPMVRQFDAHEIVGGGMMPSADLYRRTFRTFCSQVRTGMSYAAEMTGEPRTAVGVAVPVGGADAGAYDSTDVDAVETVLDEAGYTEVRRVSWPPVLDRRTFNLVREVDWMLVDIGPSMIATGLPAFLHGQFMPMIRARRVAGPETSSTSAFDRSLYGSVDVGYVDNVLTWSDQSELRERLTQQLVALVAPVTRITTLETAERYFRRASLRKETIFLSYAGEDRIMAARLSAELQKRFQSVFDYRHGAMRGGQPWVRQIFGQLAESAAGIALLSESYLKSGNCLHEAEQMVALYDAGKIRLFPIAVADGDLQLPPWLQSIQYDSYRSFNDDPVQLCDRIVSLLDHDAAPGNK